MNLHIINFNNLLTTLDFTSNLIKTTSESFVKYISEDISLGEDLIKLILYNCSIDEINSLKFVYLSNEIVLKIHKLINTNFFTTEQTPDLQQVLDGLLEVISVISESNIISDKQKKEIERVINIWADKSIFSSEKIDEIKLKLTKSLGKPITSFEDKGFISLYKSDLIDIPKNIIELSEQIDKSLFDESTKPDECNKTRKEMIKNLEDIIFKELETHKRRVDALKDIDSLLKRIDQINSM